MELGVAMAFGLQRLALSPLLFRVAAVGVEAHCCPTRLWQPVLAAAVSGGS